MQLVHDTVLGHLCHLCAILQKIRKETVLIEKEKKSHQIDKGFLLSGYQYIKYYDTI